MNKPKVEEMLTVCCIAMCLTPYVAMPTSIALPPIVIPYWSWTTQKWTGDERPYQKIRKEVYAAFLKKQLTNAVLEQYQKTAQQRRIDPVAQYRWGLAAYYLASTKTDPQARDKTIRPVFNTLDRAIEPRVASRALTYEYSRLRFLLYAWVESDHHLVALGERLLQHDSTDWSVKYSLVRLLSPGVYPNEKQLALRYVHELQHQDPKRATPGAYSLLAGIYYKCWCKSGQRTDADAAVAYYRKYLQVAPPHDPWRKEAQTWIEIIQHYQAKQDAKKWQGRK